MVSIDPIPIKIYSPSGRLLKYFIIQSYINVIL